MVDVAIVGASVAGSALAIELGSAGLSTVVFDKARFPRRKACGEGILPHGVEALRALGLRDVPGVPVEGLRYVAPSGGRADVRFEEAGLGNGLVVRREEFDDWLLRRAKATPRVEVREDEHVDAVEERADGVSVNGVHARVVVGADGIRSLFHQGGAFRRTHPRRERVGYSMHARGANGTSFVEVHLAAGGEAYVGPEIDGVSVLAVLVDRGRDVDAFIASLPGLRGVERVGPVLGASPLGSRVAPLVDRRALLIGDAAGSPDPATGEGMSLALQSALAAGEAIQRFLSTDDAGALEGYAQERRRLAAPSERMARWILWTSRGRWIADRAVAKLASDAFLFRRLVRYVCGVEPLGALEPLRLVL